MHALRLSSEAGTALAGGAGTWRYRGHARKVPGHTTCAVGASVTRASPTLKHESYSDVLVVPPNGSSMYSLINSPAPTVVVPVASSPASEPSPGNAPDLGQDFSSCYSPATVSAMVSEVANAGFVGRCNTPTSVTNGAQSPRGCFAAARLSVTDHDP